jgi:hypothetical protein
MQETPIRHAPFLLLRHHERAQADAQAARDRLAAALGLSLSAQGGGQSGFAALWLKEWYSRASSTRSFACQAGTRRPVQACQAWTSCQPAGLVPIPAATTGPISSSWTMRKSAAHSGSWISPPAASMLLPPGELLFRVGQGLAVRHRRGVEPRQVPDR